MKKCLWLILSCFVCCTAVFPAEKTIPVILTAGQSNADGRVPINELPRYIHYDYCQWSYGSGDFETATGVFVPFSPHVAKAGIEDSWGFDAMVYYLLEEYWQQPFYVIKQTMGGTAVDTTCTKSTHGWFWSVDARQKSLLKAFCQQIDLCLSQLPRNYDIKCLLWHQGESDQSAADRYHDNLKAVINHIRQYLVTRTGRKEYASLPVVCGTFAKGSRQGSPKVVKALHQLEHEDSHFHVVDASDLSLQKDMLHFDAHGAVDLGWRVFARMKEEGIAGDCLQRGKDAFKGIWPVTDPTMKKSLNGEWQLEVNGKKGMIPVPGCWETFGFCKPRYDYPDSLTGCYRTSFTVPETWKGQKVIIRLDGVLRGYDLWLNGHYVGKWESGYNTCLFDLTPYLSQKAFKGEAQQLTMQVYSRFKGYEFDCFDDWAAMGIFRDVTLMAVPKTHLSDLEVNTRMDGTVIVKPQIANATKHTTVSYELTDAEGHVVSTGGRVRHPHLWTAETPYLYTLYVYVKEKDRILQTFTHKIGIREISIAGNVLKVNGQPVKLRGVNAHATDPYRVKVISDNLTLRDMHLMKEASVNFLRLSHYPREPRFYELADSLGFYLVDEIPFGFGDKHLSDNSYQEILMTRALATVQRDKLHPSVLVWSVGNENPLPQTCIEVGNYVGSLDPSRPYCFPQVGSYFRRFWESGGLKPSENSLSPFPSAAPVYAPHYPTTGQMGGFYQHMDRPVIFTEYCHTLGISFEDHDRQWEIIEHTPGIAGGAVWEWADQGMSLVSGTSLTGEDSVTPKVVYGYEEKVFTLGGGGFEMYGNKGTDGLLYADRTPLPNYFELQHNYARAFVSSVCCDSSAAHLTLTNRYDFLNLKDNVTFLWALTNNRDTMMCGAFSPDCAPHSSSPYQLSLPFAAISSQTGHLILLHFEVMDTQGRTFLHQSFVVNKTQMTWSGHGSSSVMIRDTLIRTGRKPTLAERLTQKNRLPEKYLLPLTNSQVKAEIQRRSFNGGEEISFTLTPDTADIFRSELGLAWLLDPVIDRVQWIGYGPFASYPGRYQANTYGFWAKHQDDLYFEGNHSGIDAAFLSDKDGNGILITGDSLSLDFEQTDLGIVLTINASVSGQGPKFAKTHFPGWKKGDPPIGATFQSYYIKADDTDETLRRMFEPAANTPAPFHPFVTQYDTYLMKYKDISW